ncbi:MAG: hypothetical protein ABH846_00505 [Patescibacteria group bacterium]
MPMPDISRYIPENVKSWFAPKKELGPQRDQNQEEDLAVEQSAEVDVSPEELEKNPEAYSVSEYVRKNDDGTERRTRLLKNRSEQTDDEIYEEFAIQADDQDADFETVGDRTLFIYPKERKIEFDTINISKRKGEGLATDSYKAMIEYLNDRVQELGDDSDEPWTVEMTAFSPATEHLFRRMFNAEKSGPKDFETMTGTLRSLDDIERDEQLEIARREAA